MKRKRKPKDHPDLFEAAKLRDEALERVMRNAGEDWKNAALAGIQRCHKERRWETFIGEDLRRYLSEHGCPPPHHPNVWGSLVRTIKDQGLIVPTDEMKQPKDPSSHARRSIVYKWPA